MNRRSLGPTAPAIFPVGYGGMSLSEEGRPSEAEAIKTIHAVLDAGVELLDLSNVYNNRDDDFGHNERLFAKALKSWQGERDRVLVATKGGRWTYRHRWEVDARPERLRSACHQSLKALGVSNADLGQIRIASSIAGIETVQNRLNPFARWALKRDEVRYCSDLGIGFLADQIYGGRHTKRIGANRLLHPVPSPRGEDAPAIVAQPRCWTYWPA